MHIEWKRRLQMIGIAAGVYVVYRFLLPAVVPFLLAWGLAAWMHPLALKIEKRTKLKKSIAGAILLTMLLAAAGVLLWLGTRELLFQVKTAVSNFPRLMKWGIGIVDQCCAALEKTTGIARNVSKNYIMTEMSDMGDHFLSIICGENLTKIWGFFKNALMFGSGVVVVYMSAILILSDMEELRRKIRTYSWMVGIRRASMRLKKTTVVYLKAQFIIIAAVAAVCAAGFWMMGSPYFLILGIAIGFMDALPLLGTGAFLYPAALIFFIKGNPGVAVGCIALDVLTSLLREFMEPRLLGGKLGIPPVMVLACVYLGVLIFGGAGVILGPLAFSTAYELGREWDVWD